MTSVATQLLDGPAIAAALKVHPVTVRRWAAKGLITRRGTLHRRALYDLDEAIAAQRHADRRKFAPAVP